MYIVVRHNSYKAWNCFMLLGWVPNMKQCKLALNTRYLLILIVCLKKLCIVHVMSVGNSIKEKMCSVNMISQWFMFQLKYIGNLLYRQVQDELVIQIQYYEYKWRL